jgi:hypothetical protein
MIEKQCVYALLQFDMKNAGPGKFVSRLISKNINQKNLKNNFRNFFSIQGTSAAPAPPQLLTRSAPN